MQDLLFFNELADADPFGPADFTVDLPAEGTSPASTNRFLNRGVVFRDTVNFFFEAGKPAVWQILNLSADAHPIHLHLVSFQVLGRLRFDPIPPTDEHGLLTNAAITNPVAVAVDPNEVGWKDTVRVNPNELVTIAAIFEGYTGRACTIATSWSTRTWR